MSEALEGFIDFEMGKLYLGRDHEGFLKRFVEVDLQTYINKLSALANCGEFEEVARSADSLASTSSYVGAVQCQEIAKKISLLMKEKKFKLISFELGKLVEHSQELEKLIRKYFEENTALSNSENVDRISSSILEESSEYQSYRLKPPKKKREIKDEFIYEDEIDPFEEINKQWRCQVF